MNGRSGSLRENLRLIFAEGTAWSVMVGIGETYFVAFGLALGLGELWAALLSSIPLVAGAALQLLTPLGVRLLGSRRRWTTLTATTQALSFVPLVMGAVLGRLPPIVLFLAITLYWAAGLSTGPVWNVWVGHIIPRRIRPRFFSSRSGATQIGTLAGLLVGGLLLDALADAGRPFVGFALLFTIAAGCRYISSRLLSRQTESPEWVIQDRMISGMTLIHRLRGVPGTRVLLYMVILTAGVAIASPFITPYLLTELGFSYSGFTTLVAISYLAKILTLPGWGRLAERLGARVLLRLGGFGVTVVPILWLVSTDFVYLLVLQILAGMLWAALELATFLLMFDAIEDDERTSLLVHFNFANAVAMVGGSLVGGILFRVLGENMDAYCALWALSTAARLAAVFLLVRIVGAQLPGARMLLRTVVLRPSADFLDHPLLAALWRARPRFPRSGK